MPVWHICSISQVSKEKKLYNFVQMISLWKNRILIRSGIVMISPPSTANNTGNSTKLNLFARETDRIERTKKSYKKICTKLCKQHYWYPRSCPFPLQTLRSHPFSHKTIPFNMPVSLLNHLFPLPVSLPNPLFPVGVEYRLHISPL